MERLISKTASARDRIISLLRELNSIEGIDRSLGDKLLQAVDLLKQVEDSLFDYLD